MSCQKQKQPQAAPLLVVRFICLSLCHLYIVSAAVAPKDDRTDHLQGNWSSPLQQIKKYDDILDEDPKSEILRREKRRVDLPDLEMNGADDDPYTIVEESDECFWCDSDTPEDDDEHRAAVIYRNTITVSPGECVINKSPRWPGRYPNNVDYRWTYQTVDGSMLTFTVPVGGLQISKGCHRDKLNVRVGRTTVKKCGQFYNFVITSKSLSSMYIRFASNHRIRWHGYRGTVCASSLPTTTTTPAHTTTTSTPGTTTTTTPPPPIYCDDICGYLDGYTGRISTGTPANQSHPWVTIVDIMRAHVFVRCSGYLISRKHIITSAFCFFQETPQGINDTMVRVAVGEYDISSNNEIPAAQVLYTDNITLYTDYNAANGGGVYNIAILTMPGDGFDLNTNVAPICLANITVKNALAGASRNLAITGFGWSKNDYPVVNLTTATVTTCPFVFPDTDLFCIFLPGATSTACQGDAGAAIYGQWTDGRIYAVGHVNAVTVDYCPLSGFVFPCPANAFYISWIDEVTGPRLCNM